MAYVSSRLPQAPSDKADLLAWKEYGNNYRDVVWGFLSENICISEDDKRRLAGMSSPDVTLFAGNRAAYISAINDHIGGVTVYLLYYLAPLICNALKLPCPAPAERNCVPLARIRVRQPDCRVVSICEVSVREYVLTALLEHFYAPVRSLLPKALGALCCDQMRALTPDVWGKRIANRIGALDDADRVAMLNALEGRGAKPLDSKMLVENAFADPGREIDVETLALALLGAKDEFGNPFARPEELANPSVFLLASQILRPAVEAAFPESWNGLLQIAGQLSSKNIARVSGAAATSTRTTEDLEKLKKTVSNLEKDAKSQRAVIADLKKRLDAR